MAEQDRGNYGMSDQIRVFDGSEDDDDDREGSRLPVLIVIALVVLASFAGVVWLAYEKGVASGRNETRLAAGDTDMSSATSDSAVPQTQYRGLKIYEQPAPDDADSGPPAAAAVAPPSALAPTLRPPVSEAATQNPPAASPSSREPVAAGGGTRPKPMGVVASVAPPAPAIAASAPATTTATTGYLLQIGSYKSQQEADDAWAADKQRYGSLLSGLSPDVKKVELGAKGTWYRLRIASFSDKDSAGVLCEKLKAAGGNCLLAR